MKKPEGYKITISEYGTERKLQRSEWVKGAGEKGPNNPDAYGYAPEIEGGTGYEEKVYEQTVGTIDMPAIVAVINKIPM